MKQYTPFSNGSEACSWYADNCEICTPKCPKKRNVDMSFGTGTINQTTADWIGYDKQNVYKDYITLNSRCQQFCKWIRPKKKNKTDKNQKKLF